MDINSTKYVLQCVNVDSAADPPPRRLAFARCAASSATIPYAPPCTPFLRRRRVQICLRVGCEAAKSIAVSHGLPFVGVHHLEAHILMARLGSELEFPFLALLVSGGHCQLLKCDAIGSYSVIGGTLDDSLGEAYDKVARMLNLPIGGGGGPAVEKLALRGDPSVVKLPIPMQHRKDCDFSFAGLKNAFRMAVVKMKEIRELGEDEGESVCLSLCSCS